MIEFLTLFLGLVTGPREVGVAVGEAVAAVEIQVDGERAAVMEGEPWRVEIDFGTELVPHELTAVARDSSGEEVGRVTQALNLPRSAAEVSLLLERDGEDRVVAARLAWESTSPGGPTARRFWLDGREISAPDGDRISLPSTDDEDFHLLEAELVFAGAGTARAEVGFGGHLGRAGTELTAIPVALADSAGSLAPAATAGWFRRGSEALEVVAIESGMAELVVVRDASASAALARLSGGPGLEGVGRSPGFREARLRKTFEAGTLAQDQRFRLLYPVPRQAIGHEMSFELFPVTPLVAPDAGGIYWHAAVELEMEDEADTRLADAVAVAGYRAAAGGNRRAVVLILGPRSDATTGTYSPDLVRRYLASLRVPLVVWYAGSGKRARREWGEPVVLPSFKRYEEAVAELRAELDRQRVVWVDGAYLAHEISLAPEVTAVRLVE